MLWGTCARNVAANRHIVHMAGHEPTMRQCCWHIPVYRYVQGWYPLSIAGVLNCKLITRARSGRRASTALLVSSMPPPVLVCLVRPCSGETGCCFHAPGRHTLLCCRRLGAVTEQAPLNKYLCMYMYAWPSLSMYASRNEAQHTPACRSNSLEPRQLHNGYQSTFTERSRTVPLHRLLAAGAVAQQPGGSPPCLPRIRLRPVLHGSARGPRDPVHGAAGAEGEDG